MKLIVIGGILLLGAIPGSIFLETQIKGEKKMSAREGLEKLQTVLTNDPSLGLISIECSEFYEVSFGGQRRCYGSMVDSEKLVNIIQKKLDFIAVSGGWRQDYGVYGAFYEYREEPKVPFGITVSPVKGSYELEKNRSTKKYNNFITISVDEPK